MLIIDNVIQDESNVPFLLTELRPDEVDPKNKDDKDTFFTPLGTDFYYILNFTQFLAIDVL